MNTEVPYNSTEGPTEPNVTVYTLSDDDLGPTDNIIFIVSSIIIVVGTVLNLWFLVAILRSEKLRSCLRNKIICNIFVLHLMDSAVVMPALFAGYFSYRSGRDFACLFYEIIRIIQLIHETITNWQLVILVVVFIVHIEDFDIKRKLSPRIVQIGTWAVLAMPWAISVLVVPGVSAKWRECVVHTHETRQILKIIDTVVPTILCVILLLVAVLLRYRRFNLGHARSMRTELISQGPETDSPLAYIVAVVISSTCEVMRLMELFDVVLWRYGYIIG